MFHHSDRSRGLYWGVIIIIVGVLLLLDELRLLDVGRLWPLIIIAVGVWMIIQARHRVSGESSAGHDMGDQTVITDTENVLHSNMFGDIKVTINSKEFKSGQIRTVFGDVKVDITELDVKEGEQILRLNTVFGDIKISAPKELAFSVYSSNTAGDMKIFDEQRSGWKQAVSYQSEGYELADKKLKIVTSQIFGDVKVW